MNSVVDLIIEDRERQLRVRMCDGIDIQSLSALVDFAVESDFSSHALVRPARYGDDVRIAMYIGDFDDMPF